MPKVNNKFQVAIPKRLAAQYGIRPGDDVRFEAAGEAIRMVPSSACLPAERFDAAPRLRLFDAATDRQRKREAERRARPASVRGWTRKELYERG